MDKQLARRELPAGPLQGRGTPLFLRKRRHSAAICDSERDVVAKRAILIFFTDDDIIATSYLKSNFGLDADSYQNHQRYRRDRELLVETLSVGMRAICTPSHGRVSSSRAGWYSAARRSPALLDSVDVLTDGIRTNGRCVHIQAVSKIHSKCCRPVPAALFAWMSAGRSLLSAAVWTSLHPFVRP